MRFIRQTSWHVDVLGARMISVDVVLYGNKTPLYNIDASNVDYLTAVTIRDVYAAALQL